MPGLSSRRLSPRRLTGRALQLSAKAASIPALAPGIRIAGRPLLGLDRLRQARLGDVVPYLTPPPHHTASGEGFSPPTASGQGFSPPTASGEGFSGEGSDVEGPEGSLA